MYFSCQIPHTSSRTQIAWEDRKFHDNADGTSKDHAKR